EPLESAYELELARVKAAETRLAQVQAGQKPADIAAQAAALGRVQADLAVEGKTFQRQESLHQQGASSDEAFDRARLSLEATQHLVKENEERLHSLAEVRPVDVAVAEAELAAARAAARHPKAEGEQTRVRSLRKGVLLSILAGPVS